MKTIILLMASFFILQNSQAQSTILAREYADNAAKLLMSKISPNTGRSATAYTYEVEYDYASSRYIIDMEAQWTAQISFWHDSEPFSVRGILKVGPNGEKPTFKEISRNEAAEDAWSDETVDKIFVGIIVLSAAISD